VTSEIDLRAILTPASNAIGYTKFRQPGSHDAVYDDAGDVIEIQEHKRDFRQF